MISANALRRWHWVHKYSSLACTLFILLACLTGLPLIFSEEINQLSADRAAVDNTAQAQPLTPPSLATMAEKARALRPEARLQMLFRDPGDPGVTGFAMGEALGGSIADAEYVRLSNHDGRYLGVYRSSDGVMGFLLKLHTELLAGLGGTFFLGLMALLFVAAVVSGIVLYSPFMRQRGFARIRRNESTRARWLDYHNAASIVLTVWLLLVSLTGVINTLGNPITQYWLLNDMQAILDKDPSDPALDGTDQVPVDAAIAVAEKAVGAGDLLFVSMPGSELTSDQHYLVVFTGTTPVTSRLYYGAVINAHNGKLVGAPKIPTYLAAALLCQPLHFGDYGGLPLKLLWAIFTFGAIMVLWSGLVIWWQKHKNTPQSGAVDGVLTR